MCTGGPWSLYVNVNLNPGWCGLVYQLKGLCVNAEWYVLGKRYSTNCSKSNVGSIRYSCMLNPGLCNLVDYFVNKS